MARTVSVRRIVCLWVLAAGSLVPARAQVTDDFTVHRADVPRQAG